MKEGRLHLDLMAKVYQKQINHGRKFLRGHPATAVSCDEMSILGITMQPGVRMAKANQCQYGLKRHTKDGKMSPALKPTKYMTNAEPMARLLSPYVGWHKGKAMICLQIVFVQGHGSRCSFMNMFTIRGVSPEQPPQSK